MLTISTNSYYLCEKSDGMRYLMYCTDDGNGKEVIYLIDRRMDFWWVEGLHFPLPKCELNLPLLIEHREAKINLQPISAFIKTRSSTEN